MPPGSYGSVSNDGWVYDPTTRDYWWVTKRRTAQQGTTVSELPNVHAYSDPVKVATNGSDGDWSVVETFPGMGCIFLPSGAEYGSVCPPPPPNHTQTHSRTLAELLCVLTSPHGVFARGLFGRVHVACFRCALLVLVCKCRLPEPGVVMEQECVRISFSAHQYHFATNATQMFSAV